MFKYPDLPPTRHSTFKTLGIFQVLNQLCGCMEIWPFLQHGLVAAVLFRNEACEVGSMDRRDYATQKYENQVLISEQVLIHELSRVSQSYDQG